MGSEDGIVSLGNDEEKLQNALNKVNAILKDN